MKKFFAGLIIIIILGGLAFFFGWAQLVVPPGTYGVMRSKTHGIDPALIREGEFRWVWYKLIPTNVQITAYRLNQVNHTVSFKSSLPSGSTYTAFAGLTADFSYDISANFAFSIKPGFLVSLVSDHNIGSQEDFKTLENTLAGEIEAFIVRRLGTTGENTRELEEILTTGSSPALENAIKEQFPVVENVSCLVKTAVFPDFALYRRVQELYETYLSQQQEYMNGGLKEKAEQRIDSRLRFDELERYGELLTKYPILLQYLALENGTLAPQVPAQSGE
ncbi:MAG: hypothetical protein LBL28_08560 [Treponema sp.]|jgi:hypothetical protein|nr:hypothetical protein [Treponema sp.]